MIDLANCDFEFDYAGMFLSEGQWIHPERSESTYEIIFVTKGEVYIEEGGEEYRLTRSQAIILEPNVTHKGTRYTSDVAFYWVHFYAKGELPFDKRFFESFESLYLFKELLHYNNLPQIPKYLVNAVLTHIVAELCYKSQSSVLKFNGFAEKLYEWVRINADARLTVDSVALHFGYSPDHISRICKKYYGASAHDLINRFVIKKAKELLSNTDKYVKEIAAELSFSTDKAFIGYFKYNEACSPTEFRNRYGRTHFNKR